MPLDPKVIAAYRKAHYVIHGEPELVLKVGEPSRDLDELLAAERATTAAYVTAANPRGEQKSEDENQTATDALYDAQDGAGYACYSGEGRDPEGSWPPEPSVLVVGIARADACALGRAMEQNAIVFVEKGGAPELVLLAD